MPLPRPAPGTGRWWVIGTIGCTIGIALAVWLGLANSLGAITYTDTDYKVIDDTTVQVTAWSGDRCTSKPTWTLRSSRTL